MTISGGARSAARAALVLATWALVMAALPFFGPAGRQVAVVGDASRAVRVILDAGGMVVAVKRGAVIARSDRPGFARALYAAGAPLVVEARTAAGCLAVTGASTGA